MNSDSKDNRRHPIPRWRDYKTTMGIGELDSSQRGPTKKISDDEFIRIQEKIYSWEQNNTISNACELVTTAIVYDDASIGAEAAKFILDLSSELPISLLQHANYVLNSLDHIPNCEQTDFSLSNIYNKIKDLKLLTKKYPLNPILWVDLALCYTNTGHIAKAERCIVIATALSKNNRYVLRSASRFYLHKGDPEKSIYLLRNSNLIKTDPWILSADISLSLAINKSSPNLKNASYFIQSQNYSPHSLSEIESALGTLEFEYGNIKQAKKLVRKSIEAPNDNSLAQATFLSRNIPGLLVDNEDIFMVCPCPYEAKALYYFVNGEWESALDSCIKWQNDLPHSSRPAILGSFIASSLLHYYEKSEEIAECGRISNDNDYTLLNNLIFAKLKLNKLVQAKLLLDNINFNKVNKTERICLTATTGMYYYRIGDIQHGKKLYLEAINYCDKPEDIKNKVSAYIHFTFEEKQFNTDEWQELLKHTQNLLNKHEDKTLKTIFDKLLLNQ